MGGVVHARDCICKKIVGLVGGGLGAGARPCQPGMYRERDGERKRERESGARARRAYAYATCVRAYTLAREQACMHADLHAHTLRMVQGLVYAWRAALPADSLPAVATSFSGDLEACIRQCPGRDQEGGGQERRRRRRCESLVICPPWNPPPRARTSTNSGPFCILRPKSNSISPLSPASIPCSSPTHRLLAPFCLLAGGPRDDCWYGSSCRTQVEPEPAETTEHAHARARPRTCASRVESTGQQSDERQADRGRRTVQTKESAWVGVQCHSHVCPALAHAVSPALNRCPTRRCTIPITPGHGITSARPHVRAHSPLFLALRYLAAPPLLQLHTERGYDRVGRVGVGRRE